MEKTRHQELNLSARKILIQKGKCVGVRCRNCPVLCHGEAHTESTDENDVILGRAEKWLTENEKAVKNA